MKSKQKGARHCNGQQYLVKQTAQGNVIIITMRCGTCRRVIEVTNSTKGRVRVKVNPKKRGGGAYAMNVAAVFASLLTRMTYRNYELWHTITHQHSLSFKAYSTILRDICEATVAYGEKVLAAVRAHMRERAEPTVVALDGAWSQRGWHAHGHCFVMLDSLTGKICYMKALQKDVFLKDAVIRKGDVHNKSSKAMESVALREALACMEADGSLINCAGFCLDQDSSSTNIIDEHSDAVGRDYHLHYDPGHLKRSLQKKLKKIFGDGKGFKGIAERMATTFMRLVKRAETSSESIAGMRATFNELMWYFRGHYTIGPCPPTCFCMHELWKEGNGDISGPASLRYRIGRQKSVVLSNPVRKEKQRRHSCPVHFRPTGYATKDCMSPALAERVASRAEKEYFNPMRSRKTMADAKHWTKWQSAFSAVEDLMAQVTDFVHGYRTCLVEGAHRIRMTYAPKEILYTMTWSARCMLMVLKQVQGVEFVNGLEKHLGLEARALDIVRRSRMLACDKKHMARKSTHDYKARSLQLKCIARKRNKAATKASQKQGFTYKDTPAEKNSEQTKTKAQRRRKAPTTDSWTLPPRNNQAKRARYTQDELQEHFIKMQEAEIQGKQVPMSDRLYRCDTCGLVRRGKKHDSKRCLNRVNRLKATQRAPMEDSDEAPDDLETTDPEDDDEEDDEEEDSDTGDDEEEDTREEDIKLAVSVIECANLRDIVDGHSIRIADVNEAMHKVNHLPKQISRSPTVHVVTRWERANGELFWAVGCVVRRRGSDLEAGVPTHDILFRDPCNPRAPALPYGFRLTKDRYEPDDKSRAGKWFMLKFM